MDVIHEENCPICGSQHIEKAMTCTDHYATGETFEVWECKDCNFRFTQDFPDESVIGRYYESPDYISHSDTRRGLMNKVYHWSRSQMLKRKATLVINSSGKECGNLLDIGAGTGYFASTMQNRGWKVTAAEKSEQARDFAKNQMNVETVINSDALPELPDHSFDVITMWHVMEHVQNLDKEWSELHRLLKDDGRFVMAIPNYQSADAAIYGPYWAAYDVPRHLWHFNVYNLKQIAKNHDFGVNVVYPMPLDAFYISMLSEKYKGHGVTFLRGMWSGLRCYHRSRNDVTKSSSLIYVLERLK